MRLKDLYIYPVKSLGGIKQSEGKVLERGFEYDRRWMLVDDAGKSITQRVEHKLALLRTEVIADKIRVFNKDIPDQSIILEPAGEDLLNVSVWDDSTKALQTGEEINTWFSTYLGKSCKLVFMPETGKRLVDPRYAEHNEQVSFADAFPYLLISQSSLDDLNGRLSQSVPMNRFRPNLVVSGTNAFEEDTWAKIKIGDVYFKVAKPCARCILTTVDQETGLKGKEPLFTLSSYRTKDNKVLFGQNLIALNKGIIRENDLVEVISYKQLG
ncbi:MAG: MOSC domain-containing protein [Sphingobacteriaceae bacterium]|nr:MOSC domain-containing protein [Sphingobacteriaceae bacterium]